MMKQSEIDEVYLAIERDQLVGVCMNPDCNSVQHGGIEPDAEGYNCMECGKNALVGYTIWLLEMSVGNIDIEEDIPDHEDFREARKEIQEQVLSDLTRRGEGF